MHFTYKKIFIIVSLFLLVVVTGLTILSYFYYSPYFLKEYFLRNSEGNSGRSESFFVDLDSDGETENVEVGYNLWESNVTSFLVTDFDNNPIEQFNFTDLNIKGKINYSLDFDNDGCNEISFLHKIKDTLALSVINIKTKSLMFKNHPIYIKPDKVGKRNWDLIACSFDFHNSDKEKRYLYVSVIAGYSIFPRNLVKYDLVEGKIVDEFVTHTPMYFLIDDVNGDGDEEILIYSYAADNTRRINEPLAYPDTTAWFFLLDKNFNILWNYNYGGFTSGIQSKTITIGSNKYIINKNNTLNTSFKSSLILYDYFGKKIKEKEIPSQLNLTIDKNFFNAHYIISQEGYIYRTDSSLNIEKVYSIGFSPKINYGFKLFDKDVGIAQGEKIIIFDKNFNILAESELPEKAVSKNFQYFSIKYSNKTKEHYLVVNGNKNLAHYKIIKRSLLLELLRNFIILIGILSIVYLLVKLVQRVFIFFKTIETLQSDNGSGILLLSESLKIISMNKAFGKITGIIPQKRKSMLSQRELKEFIMPMVEKVNNKGKEIKEEIEFNTDSGNKKLILRITLIAFKKIPLAYLIRLEDYTEMIMRERSRVWFHSMQKIAHEIKTPLSSMLINLRSIEKNVDKPEVNKTIIDRDIGIIKNEISRIKNLTNNLLKFADLQKLNFQNVNILDCIEKSKEKFISFINSGIEFKVCNKASTTIVSADAYQIEEVLQVLIENGIDAVGGKGKITIELEEKNDLLEITISDNGIGIPQDELRKIFDPYFTTKKEGTGMGLAIAKKIIKDHNSELTVNSEPGKGTTFKFSLKIKG